MIQIQAGDILMFRIIPGAPMINRLIGWGERVLHQVGSDMVNYYHAGIVGPGVFHYYESAPPKIRNSDVPNPLPEYMEVYRFKVPLTPAELAKMWVYANSQLGKPYNLLGVLTGGFIEIGGVPFCSEFVWRVATYGGRVLCPWETLESPDDLAASDQLIRLS